MMSMKVTIIYADSEEKPALLISCSLEAIAVTVYYRHYITHLQILLHTCYMYANLLKLKQVDVLPSKKPGAV